MPPNSGEFKSVVGVEDLYFALVSQDETAGYAAGTPAQLAPMTEIKLEPTTSLDTQYADNQPFDVNASEGETKITVNVTNVPISTLATLLGKTFDAASGRMFDAGGGATPPDVALSFRTVKSNGKYRYYQYLKGRFSAPGEEAQTKADKADPKPQELVFTAVNTVYEFTVASGVTKTLKRIVGDEDSTNFSATGFFLQVQVPSISAPSSLALSSSTPAAGATGVSRSANLSLTYNNALNGYAVSNVTLLDASNAIVACTVTIDATKKIITIDPTPTLAASTAHKIVASVVDVYGQALASVVNFTTGT